MSEKKKSYGWAISGALIGYFVGCAVSYFFQSWIVRSRISFLEYAISSPFFIFQPNKGWIIDFQTPVVVSALVCCVALGIGGYMADPANRESDA